MSLWFIVPLLDRVPGVAQAATMAPNAPAASRASPAVLQPSSGYPSGRCVGNMIRSRRLCASGEQQQQPVDPDPEAAGRGHPVLERPQEVLVERVDLVAEHVLHLLLELELRALLVGIGELAERRDQLDARGDEVEVLGQAGVVPVRTRERRDLAREVAHERRLHDRVLDELLEQLLHDLARAPRRRRPRTSWRAAIPRRSGWSSVTSSPTAVRHRAEDRDPCERFGEVDHLAADRDHEVVGGTADDRVHRAGGIRAPASRRAPSSCGSRRRPGRPRAS